MSLHVGFLTAMRGLWSGELLQSAGGHNLESCWTDGPHGILVTPYHLGTETRV